MLMIYMLKMLDWLGSLPRQGKRAIVFALDLALLLISIWIAYSLRISEWIYWDYAVQTMLLGALPTMIVTFVAAGMYRSIFRFAGIGMLRVMAHAFLAYTAIIAFIYLIWSIDYVPRTLGLLQPIIFFLLVAGSRALFRFLMVDVRVRRNFEGVQRRVLIYGAGVTGQQLASSMRSDPEMQAVGFVDDDLRLHGQKLDGTRVFGSHKFKEAIDATAASDILLAMPSATRSQRQEIIKKLSAHKVRVKTLPHVAEILGERISISDIRPLEIQDLLGRDQVPPNDLLLGRTVLNRSVLVTGAGGSIGSELCRQIMQIGASRLILFEMSEYALYTIGRELEEMQQNSPLPKTEVVSVLGSVGDADRLREVFATYDVETVFHAAAYKHVPLVEANPLEGVRNNVIGTYECANAASAAGVSDFILISTDKAVRPTNVMGASKRAAELVVQALNAQHQDMRFSMVRFGNVLGSSGSVVPLFQRQIEEGGPITLTDRRITRFFMTIPEAAQLVVQAAGLSKGGEVFVLDMGKPVKIWDLATAMINLSGLSVRDDERPEGDIEIVEIGLREGEKLYEELLIGENPETTIHPRIMQAQEDYISWPRIESWIGQLREISDAPTLIAHLQAIVPEFEHRRDNAATPVISKAAAAVTTGTKES